MKKGFSIIEILVVISLFAIVGLIASQSVVTSLRGVKRSDSDSKVRENIDYVLSIMERHLRNASTVSCSGTNTVNFTDFRQNATSFRFDSATGSIASGSASVRITGNDVRITSATFTCDPGSGNKAPSVVIQITGRDANLSDSSGAQITTSTQIFLRTSI